MKNGKKVLHSYMMHIHGTFVRCPTICILIIATESYFSNDFYI